MSPNVNSWNNQNGIPTMQQNNMGSQSMGGGMMYPMTGNNNMMMPPNNMTNQQQFMPWEQQGWKTYSQESPKPVVGRWVSSFDDIKPRDVPMDGSICFFPQDDYTCIYAMVWGNDGTIKPFRFIPEVNVVQQPVNQEPISDPIKEVLANFTSTMNNRMDALERRIGDILTPFTVSQNTKNTGTNKKTVAKESDAT